MPKYDVEIREVHVVTVTVDVENEKDAREAANKLLADGMGELDMEYSHTLPMWVWPVTSKENSAPNNSGGP